MNRIIRECYFLEIYRNDLCLLTTTRLTNNAAPFQFIKEITQANTDKMSPAIHIVNLVKNTRTDGLKNKYKPLGSDCTNASKNLNIKA